MYIYAFKTTNLNHHVNEHGHGDISLNNSIEWILERERRERERRERERREREREKREREKREREKRERERGMRREGEERGERGGEGGIKRILIAPITYTSTCTLHCASITYINSA